ncbi:MAG: TatD family hydrolase [Candidatus Aenigmatarchaeota archaeon]
MIDVHCHLEQKDYDKDRDEVIGRCEQELDAVITSCAAPRDFELTMELVKRYKNFVFATVGVHPEYIKEIGRDEISEFLETVKKSKDSIVGIGEIGLDYWWTKESEWQAKQRELFAELIRFAEKLKKPIVVHSRDAHEDTIRILEEEGAKDVNMHMFGANNLAKRVVDNGWLVSLNTIVLRSKKHKKVARDVPIEKLMLETDAPWLSTKGGRNEPTAVTEVAVEIAKIKKMDVGDVKEITARNAVRFFSLGI